jgi:RNA polymerase sigma-70 factor (ECF subfamily)
MASAAIDESGMGASAAELGTFDPTSPSNRKRKEVVADDFQLLDETLAGRSAAFGQLVAKYQDRLYNTLVHVTGSAEDARDVAQEAFVQAFIKLESFQRGSAFYTWLYRIALNLAISLTRRRTVHASVDEMRQQTGAEPADTGDAPSDRLERSERAIQVQAALANLGHEFRAVVVLREIEGYCYEDIAAMLEIPVGTVRSRLHRGRLLLREQLKAVLVSDG